MKLDLAHTTTYRYSSSVSHGLQQLRLVAESNPAQSVESWSVTVEGATSQVRFRDHHGNQTELVSLDPSDELTITVLGSVVTTDLAGVLGDISGPMPTPAYRRSTPLTQPGPLVTELVQEIPIALDGATISELHELSAAVRERVDYVVDETDVTTTAEQALQAGVGVCQDHTHVFLSAARLRGVPARYVSGYLWLAEHVDQAASHAWGEVWLAELGWVGFDVSNQLAPDDRYVRLAVGHDYHDAAPLSGVRIGGGDETMTVALSVQAEDAATANTVATGAADAAATRTAPEGHGQQAQQ